MQTLELLKEEATMVNVAPDNSAYCEVAVCSNQSNPCVENNVENTYSSKKAYLITKRCFDIAFSLVVGLLTLIPVLVLMLLIVVQDRGRPFYVQKRVGQNGKEICVIKLRSMKMHADNLETMLTPEQLEEYRREYKLDDDPRLLGWKKAGDGKKCFGSIIRRASLDELPQILCNILVMGNMSVVGPRPILHEELVKNYTPEEQDMLLSLKPGLTGYWQAYARNDATYETGERQRMELHYAANRSLLLDLKIVFATVGAVLRKTGAK